MARVKPVLLTDPLKPQRWEIEYTLEKYGKTQQQFPNRESARAVYMYFRATGLFGQLRILDIELRPL